MGRQCFENPLVSRVCILLATPQTANVRFQQPFQHLLRPDTGLTSHNTAPPSASLTRIRPTSPGEAPNQSIWATTRPSCGASRSNGGPQNAYQIAALPPNTRGTPTTPKSASPIRHAAKAVKTLSTMARRHIGPSDQDRPSCDLSLANIASGKKALTFAQLLAILQSMRNALGTVAALRSALSTRGCDLALGCD